MKTKSILAFIFIFLSFSASADDQFNIYKSYQKAHSANRPIYYVVANGGCSHCESYLKNTITPNFQEINRNFVFALSDLSKGDKVPSNIPFDGTTPTTYILSPNGKLMIDPIKGDFGPNYFRQIMDKLYEAFSAR